MNEKSTHHNHGGTSDQQWYELHPDRLLEEIKRVEKDYPGFKVHKKQGENLFWTGTAKFAAKDGKVLFELKIKVECPKNYPVILPIVHDVEKVLSDRRCPHIYSDTKNICYGNRLDPQLNFIQGANIRDLIDYVSAFLGKQWYFEKFGTWPGEHAHGSRAFLNYEMEKGTIDPTDLCPCGHNTKTYRECHIRNVQGILLEMDNKLPADIRAKIHVPGRNDLCPCESKVKFKKCCQNKINHPASRIFLMQKYPKWVQSCISK